MSQSIDLDLLAEDASRQKTDAEHPAVRDSANIDSTSPLPGPGSASYTGSGFADGSGALLSMYLERAEEEDKKMTDSWKGDADGILVFVSLVPNSQDASAFYLSQIYQQTVTGTSNGSTLLPSSPLPNPSSFSPSASAVCVNVLWFLSLVVSLTCALLATLLQQWARRYLRVTKPRYSLYRRAYIRALFADGVERLYLPSVVEALPGLLHASVFLFFAGLVVFLFETNRTVFAFVLSSVASCVALYACVTILPLVRHDSPYYTPLSNFLWPCILRMRNLVILASVGASHVWNRLVRAEARRHRRSYELLDRRDVTSIVSEAEAVARFWSVRNLSRALVWTFSSLDEDHELEQFLAGIPDFHSSKQVYSSERALDGLTSLNHLGFSILSFMGRSLTSDFIAEHVKQRRSAICIKALRLFPAVRKRVFMAADTFHMMRVEEGPIWIELGIYASQCTDDADPQTRLFAQFITASLTKAIGHSDHRWLPVMASHLNASEPTLQEYLVHGDSLPLANLIRFTRLWMLEPYWLNRRFLVRKWLAALLAFDATAALPELQHEFCSLWNQACSVADDEGEPDSQRQDMREVLINITPVFVALHPETGAALSVSRELIGPGQHTPPNTQFPRCADPLHHPVSPDSHTPTVSTSHETGQEAVPQNSTQASRIAEVLPAPVQVSHGIVPPDHHSAGTTSITTLSSAGAVQTPTAARPAEEHPDLGHHSDMTGRSAEETPLASNTSTQTPPYDVSPVPDACRA
ncbi:hypothetical protein BC834DRAFT_876215 [Gloeopeniophorella convolvens]|nr:hypothetical protein BC834DRAFT_876215 [Gloeopeniophorella convolvens]